MTRVEATIKSARIEIGSDIKASEGAPASLTYHRLVGNYLANDAFLIRGHFDSAVDWCQKRWLATAEPRTIAAWAP